MFGKPTNRETAFSHTQSNHSSLLLKNVGSVNPLCSPKLHLFDQNTVKTKIL